MDRRQTSRQIIQQKKSESDFESHIWSFAIYMLAKDGQQWQQVYFRLSQCGDTAEDGQSSRRTLEENH